MDKIIKHGLQITAGLDPSSQKEMRAALRSIFTDEAHIDFNNPANIKGLKDFTILFKKMFESVGNKKFDFNKMMELPGPEMFKGLTEAAKEFEGVWSSIASKLGDGGLKNVFMRDASELSVALNRLTDNQGKFIKKQAEIMQKSIQPNKSRNLNQLLESASGLKQDFVKAKYWEEQTVAALNYLNVYERIMQMTDGDIDLAKEKGMRIDLSDVFKELGSIGQYAVQQIEAVRPQMQASLQNLFNLKNGKPLIGLTDGGTIDINVAPKIIKTLDVGDVLGGKKTIEVPIDLDFKGQLDKLFDLANKSGKEAGEQAQQLINDMVKGLPLDVQEKAIDRLWRFSALGEVKDRNYNAIWKDFVGYGLPIGMGTSGGTGIGGDSAGIHKEIADAKNADAQAQERLNVAEGQNPQTSGEIKQEVQAYEELTAAVQRLVEIRRSLSQFSSDAKQIFSSAITTNTKNGALSMTNVKNTIMNDFNSAWEKFQVAQENLKSGTGSQGTIDAMIYDLKALAEAYRLAGGKVSEFANEQQRAFAQAAKDQRHGDNMMARELDAEIGVSDKIGVRHLQQIIVQSNTAEEAVQKIISQLSIGFPKAAQQAGQAVDGINKNLEKKNALEQSRDDKTKISEQNQLVQQYNANKEKTLADWLLR